MQQRKMLLKQFDTKPFQTKGKMIKLNKSTIIEEKKCFYSI